MRLGAYPCVLQTGSNVLAIYDRAEISERHRHRFEVNNEYRERFAAEGLVFAGLSPDGGLVEIIELSDHPFFVATQFHPELKSRPTRPHPLFAAFIGVARDRRDRLAESRGEEPSTALEPAELP
jgi:CTP synthase